MLARWSAWTWACSAWPRSQTATSRRPRHRKRPRKTIKRLQQAVSRKQKGSQNRKKAVKRRARQQRRVANLRADTWPHLTARLAKTPGGAGSDDRNGSGRLKNHALAQATSADVGFAACRRQLEYTAAWYGCRLLVADRWCASSRTSSWCGWGTRASRWRIAP